MARAYDLLSEGLTCGQVASAIGETRETVKGWQRRHALQKANRVRMKKAAIKRQLATGELSIVEILKNPPMVLRVAPIVEILEAAPGIGPSRSRKLMASLNLSENGTFAWLSPERRCELADAIPLYEVGPARKCGAKKKVAA
jgi:hypothetical protein